MLYQSASIELKLLFNFSLRGVEMIKPFFLLTTLSIGLTACVSYSANPIVTSPAEREAIAQHSQSVQQQEYIERAERRSEQHEERMNQAEAYKHATSGQNVILLNNHRKAHRVTPIFIR
jgi:hypothetical protein